MANSKIPPRTCIRKWLNCQLVTLCALVCWLVLTQAKSSVAEELSFNRDIRPILSENCFHCHGPDGAKRQADLALHEAEEASAVIEAGKPESSLLIERIFDTDDPMPPADSNRALSAKQKELLRRWIAEGANFQTHWAFIPPERPELPRKESLKAPIDQFVEAKLQAERIAPTEQAEPKVLARRASLALTGLHPTPELMQGFLNDDKSGAYERFVDRLLDSDAYAERMTLWWLDAARYADTDGYQNDAQRKNWPWRDWVIDAYRKNMPFDQFTIEQLAGDMLPNPTHNQRLATAFNRNHRQNSEGGALAEEFFVENVIDRVETTSTVWLGLTTGCARCHDHKYDPISQREFYQLFAYFDNIGESGFGKGVQSNPILQSSSPIRDLPAYLVEKREAAKQRFLSAKKSLPQRFEAWRTQFASDDFVAGISWLPVEQARKVAVDYDGTKHRVIPQADGTYEFDKYSARKVSYGFNLSTRGEKISGIRFELQPTVRFGAPARFAPSGNGNLVVTNVIVRFVDKNNQTHKITIDRADATFEQPNYGAANLSENQDGPGWAISGADTGQPIYLRLQFKQPIKPDEKGRLSISLEQNSPYENHTIGQLRLAFTTHPTPVAPPAEVLSVLEMPENKWSESQQKKVHAYYERFDSELAEAKRVRAAVENEIKTAGYANVPVMVMNESDKIRPTYLLNRGQYDDPDKSAELSRTVPEALLAEGTEPPANRLELARWLMSRENPITARVVVNRMWQHMFGVGLVKTAEDFGSQGERPSHPRLLDWLAIEFMDSGWDVKHLYRQILTSETFRRSSRVMPELHAKDPENRLLARGPRFRMDGFALRDMALQTAGLLNSEVGGPPVKPYQPTGLWSTLGSSPGDRYVPDKGKQLYRKSMYTYWRRAVNPPRQTIFDASGREVCNVRHRVTNTPLQALALMNDETFVEAARHLAARMIREGGTNASERLAYGYRLATSYEADESTLRILAENQEFFEQHYDDNKEAAAEYLSIGESPVDNSLEASEHAAYAATAHLILNMDEVLVIE